ncbi:LacI family DNA-binding transcriptional regulator [Microbacterium lacusdiani]
MDHATASRQDEHPAAAAGCCRATAVTAYAGGASDEPATRRVGIKDVAAAAGVSPTTVSNALSGARAGRHRRGRVAHLPHQRRHRGWPRGRGRAAGSP